MKLYGQSIALQLRLVQVSAIHCQTQHFWKPVFRPHLLENFDEN